MNLEEKQLVNLLMCFINQEIPDNELFVSEISAEFLNRAFAQNIGALFVPILRKHADIIKVDEFITSKWKNTSFYQAIQQVTFTCQIKLILNELKLNSIKAITLKGLVLKSLYPQPDLRAMCDLDLLIKKEEIPLAVSVLNGIGYKIREDFDIHDPTNKHIDMYHPKMITVEIHNTLRDPHLTKNMDEHAWLKHIWDTIRDVEIEGIELIALSLEDELINQVVHIATHIVYEGSNLRQLCDVALFIKNYWEKIDHNYFYHMIKSMELYVFSQHLFYLLKKYFKVEIIVDSDVVIDEHICNTFIKEILERRSFNKETWHILSRRYPYFRNNQLFSPLVIAFETCYQILKNKKKISESIEYSEHEINEFKKRAILLKKLGLYLKVK
jgi:hypothetical protein